MAYWAPSLVIWESWATDTETLELSHIVGGFLLLDHAVLQSVHQSNPRTAHMLAPFSTSWGLEASSAVTLARIRLLNNRWHLTYLLALAPTWSAQIEQQWLRSILSTCLGRVSIVVGMLLICLWSIMLAISAHSLFVFLFLFAFTFPFPLVLWVGAFSFGVAFAFSISDVFLIPFKPRISHLLEWLGLDNLDVAAGCRCHKPSLLLVASGLASSWLT